MRQNPILAALVLIGLASPSALAYQHSLAQTFEFEYEGLAFEAQVEPYSVRAADFGLMVESAPGVVEELPSPGPSKLFRGTVAEWGGAEVILSMGDEVQGVLLDRNTGSAFDIRGDRLYMAPEEEEGALRPCGCESLGGAGGLGSARPSSHISPSRVAGSLQAGAVHQRFLVIDTDDWLFQIFGGDEERLLNYVELIAGVTSAIFEGGTDVQLLLRAVLVRPTAGLYGSESDSVELANLVKAYWSGMDDSIVHLFTGRTMANGFVGRAFMGHLCDDEARGVDDVTNPTIAASANIFAHELGHNFNQQHCDGQPGCGLMNSIIDTGASSAGAFAPSTADDIRAFSLSRGCSASPSVPMSLPAVENTTSAGVDTDFWDATNYAAISGQAVRIGRSDPAGYPLPGRLLSHPIALTTAGAAHKVTLSALYIDAGGGALRDDTLVVEYGPTPDGYRTIGEVELSNNEIVSGAEFWTPPSLTFDASRLRLRQKGSGFGQYWYVIDLTIEESEFQTYFCITLPNSVSELGGTMAATGSGSISAGDLTLVAQDVPANQTGLFIMAESPFGLTPLGNGYLCLAGELFRYPITSSDAAGTATQVADLTTLPFGSSFIVGENRYFQFWHRDSVGAGSNLTGGLTLTFTP